MCSISTLQYDIDPFAVDKPVGLRKQQNIMS